MSRGSVFMLCVNLLNVTGLENKKRRHPSVAFKVTRNQGGCKFVLSKPAKDGGENSRFWIDEYRFLCDEHATLTMFLFYKGTKYDEILGQVSEVPVSDLTPGSHELPVLNWKSGTHSGGFLKFSVRVVPTPCPLRSFTVTVHRAEGLQNVKPLWKRISLKRLRVRKMKPYLVLECNHANEPPWVSPIAGKDGTDPEFNCGPTFTCKNSLFQQDELSVTIELHHRHKAKRYRGLPDQVRAGDIMIGTVELMIKDFPMKWNGRPKEYHVRTPKGKHGGKLYVSVALGELEQPEQEILTPSPSSTSWEPRVRPQAHGHLRIRDILKRTLKCAGPATGTVAAIAAAS